MIKKALIPAAGFGTRFLPQTKAMPKEMMPLVDKPIIQRVVEELVEAGIETIVIVTGWNKRSIEDHFDNNFELEQKLEAAGKLEELNIVRKISDMAEFVYIRQKGPIGNATPILNAKHIMGGEPFIVSWGDDFIDATPSRTSQLLKAYEKYQSPILGTMIINKDSDYQKYGFAKGQKVENGLIKVEQVIEKPGSRDKSPSDLAILSGFIITPDIYEYLEEAKGELENGQELIYLMGIQRMINASIPVYALEIQNGVYRDTGNKLEYLKTMVEYGLKHEEVGEEFSQFIQSKVKGVQLV